MNMYVKNHCGSVMWGPLRHLLHEMGIGGDNLDPSIFVLRVN